MNINKNTFLSVVAGFLMLAGSQANATIMFDDSTPGTITVSWDETFTMTAPPTAEFYYFLVVKDLFVSADGPNWFEAGDSMSQTFSVNGGPEVAGDTWGGWQYRGGPEGSYDQQDLLLGVDSASVPAFGVGDTIRWVGEMVLVNLSATVRMPDVLNGHISTSYIANRAGVFSERNSTTVFIGDAIPVPSPAPLALLGLGLVAACLRMKRHA